MRGINPPPPSVASFSAACLAPEGCFSPLSTFTAGCSYYSRRSEISEGAGGFSPLKEVEFTGPSGPGIVTYRGIAANTTVVPGISGKVVWPFALFKNLPRTSARLSGLNGIRVGCSGMRKSVASPVPKSKGPGAPSMWFLGRRDRGPSRSETDHFYVEVAWEDIRAWKGYSLPVGRHRRGKHTLQSCYHTRDIRTGNTTCSIYSDAEFHEEDARVIPTEAGLAMRTPRPLHKS